MKKNVFLALLLSVIPGVGHLYFGRIVRGTLYLLISAGILSLGAVVSFTASNGEPFITAFIVTLVVWVINIVDMIITTLLFQGQQSASGAGKPEDAGPRDEGMAPPNLRNERVSVILLSLIPGLGHFQMGLMNRGLTLLIGFFGLFAMILFVSFLTNETGFLVFLFALPVVWLYGLFDAAQLLNRKERGEKLLDRSFLEELEEQREQGRKSKAMATFLSIFPGAGHLYIGMQKRGLQLMAGFLFSIYILDALHLSFFLFVIPLIWFYSFFDALQHVPKDEHEEVKDVPIVDWVVHHQRWFGFGLLALGLFYLLDQIVLPVINRSFPGWRVEYYFDQYFQTAFVAILLIGGGLKLLSGSGKKNGKEDERG